MLRTEVLLWMLIFWIVFTCVIALDIYARIENDKATKRMEAIAQDMLHGSSASATPNKVSQKEIEETDDKQVKLYYDVPLSEDLQDHIFEECAKYNIDPAIVIAIIGKETGYNPDAVGDGGESLGLMQIQPKWHRERLKKLNITNLFNPYQNVTVGIDILGELFATGKSIEWVLMAYNGGRSYANEKLALGMVSDYANTVLTNARLLDKYEVVEEV